MATKPAKKKRTRRISKSKPAKGGGSAAATTATTTTTAAATAGYLEPALAEVKRRALETGQAVKDTSRRSSARLGDVLGREVHEHAAAVLLAFAAVALLLLMGFFRRGSKKQQGDSLNADASCAQEPATEAPAAADTPASEGTPGVVDPSSPSGETEDQQRCVYDALPPAVAEDLRAATAAASATAPVGVLEDAQEHDGEEDGAGDMLAAVVGKVEVDDSAGVDPATSASHADVAAAISAADDALADAALIMEDSATAAAAATAGTAVHTDFNTGDVGADGDAVVTASRSLEGEIEAGVDGSLALPAEAAPAGEEALETATTAGGLGDGTAPAATTAAAAEVREASEAFQEQAIKSLEVSPSLGPVARRIWMYLRFTCFAVDERSVSISPKSNAGLFGGSVREHSSQSSSTTAAVAMLAAP